MPAGTPALVALGNITLSSTATSVTFDSISQAYRDLYIVISHLGSGGDAYTLLQFNNDTSYGSYYYTVLQGSTAYNGTSSGFSGSYSSTSVKSGTQIHVMDYSATDKHKMILTRNGRSDAYNEIGVKRWQYNTAVTSVKISTSSNAYAAGSKFALYGVSA